MQEACWEEHKDTKLLRNIQSLSAQDFLLPRLSRFKFPPISSLVILFLVCYIWFRYFNSRVFTSRYLHILFILNFFHDKYIML